jgi:DNA-binding MarR family transcriptional regulator
MGNGTSHPAKAKMIGVVAELIASFQDATQAVDEAAAEYLGVNLTDLRCLGLIARAPMTLGELAVATGRTPAAMTVAVDRLERAGLAERVPDVRDRRRIRVQPSELAHSEMAAIWGPIADEGAGRLSKYTVQHLEILMGFMQASIQMQEKHAKRLRLLRDDKAAS